ncbi:PEP-CTERM sorting domain-containing protein [Microseira wollei]|uniref:PEP motif-containing protein n=1 Tax=Microseira wollei NIES-4236 TaxID=2530354 RepID=A0AAV3XFP9_9CYAN|nr:PEP-CTERM sorting domain-containing protein [Microseira wollei]GET40261.1 PEP motif-containing protein [Microseira wollei NIES-4236]
MANSIYQKLALATAGTVLSLAVMETASVQAATITYDFTVNITDGPLLGNQYSGFFSYDDTSPSATSLPVDYSSPSFRSPLVPVFDVTEFNFDFAGKTYTKSNLRYDGCRAGIQFCYPLTFSGTEAVLDPSGFPRYLIPRGGDLSLVSFSNFSSFNFSIFSVYFYILGGKSAGDFRYDLPLDLSEPFKNRSGSGTVGFSLRTTPTPPPTSVPEPGTVFGLSVLGFGWLLRKKKASSHA